MCNVFNMGIGFMMAVDKKRRGHRTEPVEGNHEESYVIGEVTK